MVTLCFLIKKRLILYLNESSNLKNNYFDESFFMYLENNDDDSIDWTEGWSGSVTKAKINHLGAKAVDQKYNKEIELSRNWHWIWSKFYFKKKHFGFLKAFLRFSKFYFINIEIYIVIVINNKVKKDIYFNRASGFFNALIGKSSWYRPNLDD